MAQAAKIAISPASAGRASPGANRGLCPTRPRAGSLTGERLRRRREPIDETAKDILISNMRREYWTVARTAADIGTLVHRFAEDYVAGKRAGEPIVPWPVIRIYATGRHSTRI